MAKLKEVIWKMKQSNATCGHVFAPLVAKGYLTLHQDGAAQPQQATVTDDDMTR